MAKDTTTKFKVDISDLKKGIQEANRQIRLANAEFKSASAGMDNWAKSADGLSAKITQTQKVLKAQKTILSDYEKQLALIEKQYGADSKEADEMRIKLENQKAAVKNAEKSLSDYSAQLADLESGQDKAADLSDELGSAVEQSGKDAEKAGDGFTVFKGVLSDLAATAIKKVVSGLKDIASAAKESYQAFDDGEDNLIKATGATGESAESLKKSYAEVAKSVVGDLGDIGSAVGEVKTRLGFTDEQLEDATTQFLKFSDITGTDAVSSIQSVSRAMFNAGINADDYSEVLDQLAKAAQESGIGVDKLTDNLQKYGAPMRQLGFSTKESIAIFAQWEKAGVNTETAFSGMKKAIGNWSKEGKDAKKEFQSMLDTIKNAPNDTKAAEKAVEAFGTKAGPELAESIRKGSFEYSEFLKIIDDSKDTVSSTFEATQDGADKAQLAMQNMKVSIGQTVSTIVDKYSPEIQSAIEAITPVIENVIKWLAENIPPAIDKIKEVFDKIAPIIKGAFGWIIDNKEVLLSVLTSIGAAFAAWKLASLVTGIVSLVKAIKIMGTAAAFAAAKQWLLNTALLSNPIALVAAAVAGLIALIVALWKNCESFREFWKSVWEQIKKIAAAVWQALKDFAAEAWKNLKEIWKALPEFFGAIWEDVKKIFSIFIDLINHDFSGAWEKIKDVWGNVVGFFSGIWDGIKAVFAGINDYFGGIFSTAWDTIKGTFSTASDWFRDKIIEPVAKFFSGMWDGIKDGAKKAWDGITGVFGSVADWFKDKFSKAWQAVKDVFSTGGKVFEGIKDGIVTAFKAVVNAIIRGINKVVSLPFDAINGILQKLHDLEILGLHPFDWLTARLPVPQIPELAKGGVLKRGQVGLLEGNGAEAVVPLENNKAWIAATASQLRKSLASEGLVAGANGTGVTNNYNFTQHNTSPKALSRLEIYRQSKNLLSMKGAS